MRRRTLPAVAGATLALAFGTGDYGAATTGTRPFTLDDGLALTLPVQRMPPHLSPDGRYLAFGARPARGVEDFRGRHYGATGIHNMVAGSEVWLSDLDGGGSRSLTPGWGSSWAPRWSPDGSLLAFYSDAGGRPEVYLWHRHENRFETPRPTPSAPPWRAPTPATW